MITTPALIRFMEANGVTKGFLIQFDERGGFKGDAVGMSAAEVVWAFESTKIQVIESANNRALRQLTPPKETP